VNLKIALNTVHRAMPRGMNKSVQAVARRFGLIPEGTEGLTRANRIERRRSRRSEQDMTTAAENAIRVWASGSTMDSDYWM
jgi:hypothetical protein